MGERLIMPFTDLLNSVATIQRRADTTSDGMGPATDTGVYHTVMVGSDPLQVPCRVAKQSARARFKARDSDKDAIIDTVIIFTDYRVDIFARDRFVVDGLFYDTEDATDPGLMHHHLEFIATRVS